MTTRHFSPVKQAYSRCGAKVRACPYKDTPHISEAEYHVLLQNKIINRETFKSRNIKLINVDGNPTSNIKVAPEGYIGLYCFSCDNYITNSLAEKVIHNHETKTAPKCNHCNDKLELELMGVDLRYTEQKFLNPDNVKKTSWYHITTHPNWHDSITENEDPHLTPMVHVGSKEAALDRLKDLRKWRSNENEYYLYEVKLTSDANINPNILNDENELAPSNVAQANKTKGFNSGVNRYVNLYEAPGTISLCANPQQLTLIKATIVS